MQIETKSFESLESTYLWAKQNVSSLDPTKMTIILADEQTKGKGRCQRCWFSPKGVNIYATFYFQVPKKTLHMTCLAHLLSFSFATVLLKEDLHPKIKWPNDILINDKKLAGVLCEAVFIDDKIDIFLSIGINVNMDKELLEQIDQPATSLKVETNRVWDRDCLFQKLQVRFEKDLDTFLKNGFAPFHSQFENLLAYKGNTVTCKDNVHEWTGMVHSITCDGELNLLLPNKEMVCLSCGDISIKKSE